MKLTKDTVKKVAKLANLPITPDEGEVYANQLSAILEYVKQLNEVDTKGVEPTFNVTGLTNVTRDDQAEESLPQAAALHNAVSKNGFFVTKGVFEEE